MATTINFYFDARLINVPTQVLSDAMALCFRKIELFYSDPHAPTDPFNNLVSPTRFSVSPDYAI